MIQIIEMSEGLEHPQQGNGKRAGKEEKVKGEGLVVVWAQKENARC